MNSKKTVIIGLAWFTISFPPVLIKTVADDAIPKKGMIKVTIFYPNAEGKTFDMEYYYTKHMPMVANLLGDSLKLYKIDKGLTGRTPDEAAPYLAIGYLYFDDRSCFQNSLGPNSEKIRGDLQNYTNIQPIVQVSEVIH